MSTVLKSNLQVYLNQLPSCNESRFANCVKIQINWYRNLNNMCGLNYHILWGGPGCSPIEGREYSEWGDAGGSDFPPAYQDSEFLTFGTFDAAYDFGKRIYMSLGYTEAMWAYRGIPNLFIYTYDVPWKGFVFGWESLDAPFKIFIWDGRGRDEDRRCRPEKTNICLPIAYCKDSPSHWGIGDIISGALQAELLIPPGW